MRTFIYTFISGFLFALGLAIAGMTMPSKVIAFLDIFGQWDISLIFVMAGAISVYSLIFHFVKPKLKTPLCDSEFKLPTRTKIDLPLVIGAALFGAGWGLGGFCPGPAITSLSLMNPAVLVFVVTMLVGMYIGMYLQPMIPKTLYRND
ncbi:MAG: YeeE/YedE family protein [Enterobacterales bacterium]|nr:YeeE/YedE family protein [Enterobacterales bacterium]